MRRILCIWLPNWPWQQFARNWPGLRRKPIAWLESQRRRRIVACSPRAWEEGIRPGMSAAEAAALVAVRLEMSDPQADCAALRQLAQECERFSPVVGVEEAERAESLFLDVTGLAPLFGGEASLAEQVSHWLDHCGLAARIAVADTLGGAWGLAHHHPDGLSMAAAGHNLSALAELPLEALRLPPRSLQTLHELGIERIAQLLLLPRAGLAARLGDEVIDRLDQMLGAKPEMIVAHRPPPEIVAQRSFDDPVGQRAAIDFVLGQLLAQVVDVLVRRQQGALKIECCVACPPGEPLQLQVGLFQPTASQRHLLELVQMELDRRTLPGPASGLRVSVVLAAPLLPRQRELFSGPQDARLQLALLWDRLSSRIGRHGVLGSLRISEAQPEYAYRYEPLVGAGRGRRVAPPRKLPLRPLLLEPQPVRLLSLVVEPGGQPAQFSLRGRQHRVAYAWGPERIQTGWWRGAYIRRDYYRVETQEGRRFWLFRQGKGDWFLHGIFD